MRHWSDLWLRGVWTALLSLLAATAGWAQTPVGTVIVNTARATYADHSGVRHTELSSAVEISVAAGAYLSARAEADFDPLLPGDELQWTLVVHNPGNTPALEVELRASLTGPVDLVDGGEASRAENGDLVWPAFSLASGAQRLIPVRVRAAANAADGDTLAITWSARSANAGQASASSRSQVVGAPNLALTLEPEMPQVLPGQQFNYLLGYRNRGSMAALQPRLSDELPPELEFVSAQPPPTQQRGQVLLWALDRIERGQQGQISLKVRVRDTVSPETEVTNILALAGLANPPPVLPSEPALSLVRVASPLEPLGFAKEFEAAQLPLGAGDLVVFRLVLDNPQSGSREGVVVRDTLDPLLVIEAVETDGALRQEGQAVEVFWDRLAAGLSDTVRIHARLREGVPLPDSLVNRAWAAAPLEEPIARSVVVPLKGVIREGVLTASEKIMAGQPLAVMVADLDQDRDQQAIDSVQVVVENPRSGEREALWLRETGAAGGVFAGSLPTGSGQGGDGLLTVAAGDQVRVVYLDLFNPTGSAVERVVLTRVLGTRIEVRAEPPSLVANGRDQALLTARVTDTEGAALPPGLEVLFLADLGSFEGGTPKVAVPVRGTDGEAQVLFTAPALAGNASARVVAIFGGVESAPIQLQVLPGAGAIRVFDQVRGEEVRADDPDLDVEVRLVGVTVEGTSFEMIITLDQGGLFIIPEIPPGRYQLLAKVVEIATGRIISDGKLQDIVVEADGSTTPPANAVSGTLKGKGDLSGARYAGATVELLDEQGRVLASAVVGEDGTYDFQNLPPGLYILRATLPDGTTARVEVSPRSVASGSLIVNADILIDPFGLVFDAGTGAPVAGAVVALRFLDGQVLPIPRLNGTGAAPNGDNINPFTSTPEGRYAFLFGGSQVGAVGKPAEYYLTATPPAGSSYLERRFRIQVEPATDAPIEIATITMRVNSEDGLPMARPNDVALTADPVFVPDIETIAFNIPLFSRTPILSLGMAARPDSVALGEEVLFELTVANAGNLSAGQATVVDTLGAAWQLVAAEGGEVAGNVASWVLPELAAGQADTLRLRAQLKEAVVGTTVLTERAWLKAEGLLPVQATAAVALRRPAWALDKRVSPTLAGPGDLVRYVLSYRNSGSAAGAGIALIDSLPAGLELVEAPGARTEGRVLVWDRPALAPGSSDSVFLVARLQLAAGSGAPIVNTALLLQSEGDDTAVVQARSVCTLSTEALEATLSKEVDRSVLAAGEAAEYTLVLQAGARELVGWRVRDVLPPELVFAGDSSGAASYDPPTNALTWEVPPVAKSEQWTARFAVKARPGLEPGEHPTLNLARANLAELEVVSAPAAMQVVVSYLRVGLKVDQTVVEPGEVAVYRATLENTSQDDSLRSVDLAVVMPRGFRYLPGSARLDGAPAPSLAERGLPASQDSLVVAKGAQALYWSLPGLAPAQRRELSFHAVAGVGATDGDGLALAQARATGTSGLRSSAANQAQARLRVQPSELFELGQLIIGRAWIDLDGDGQVDPGEPPVPGVVLALDDGTRIIADRHGRFSVPQVERADRVVRLLADQLPPGLEPQLAPHALGDPWTRLISPGRASLAKANFPFRQVLPDTVVPPPVAVEPEPPPPPPLVWVALERQLSGRLAWSARALHFATGSVELGAPERALLDSVAYYLRAAAPLQLSVEGHADVQRVARLPFANNQDLGLARAWAVARYLAAAGVDSIRMEVLSRGDQQPIADNSTAEGRSRNRRVELVPQGLAPELRLLRLRPVDLPPGVQVRQEIGPASLVVQGATAESLWVAFPNLRQLPDPVLLAPGPAPWSRQDSSAVDLERWQTQIEALPAGEGQR